MIKKFKELNELAEITNKLKAKNKKIVLCHGCFDLLHIGHIRHLKKAKEYGDILIVTLTPDKYVNKGGDRPVFNEFLRMEAISSLEFVNYVAINDSKNAVNVIKLLKPDFYVKGIEYLKSSLKE